MNLQTLSIILIIIILPITLILSAYTQTQINTLSEQTLMKTRLRNATYDAVVAFQLNTVHNTYSTVSDSMRRDVNAVIQSFMTNLAGKIGMSGASENVIKPYIPAIVFTMYDGYYIYSPAKTDKTDENGNSSTTYDHVLKPYIYYTKRYVDDDKNIDIVVNYSLDNYIVITGNVGTQGYVTKAGYLVAKEQTVDEKEDLVKRLPITTITFKNKDNKSSIDNSETFDIELADVHVTSELMKVDRLQNGVYLEDTRLFVDPEQLSINYKDDFLEVIAQSVLNARLKNPTYSDLSTEELQNAIEQYKTQYGTLLRDTDIGKINLSENLIKYKNTLYKNRKYYKPNNMIGNVTSEKFETGTYNTGFYVSPSSDNYYVDSTSAKTYYENAKEFTAWVNEYLGDLKAKNAVGTDRMEDKNFASKSDNIFKISESNDPERDDSIFTDHKRDVIKQSIQTNLSQAIESYNQNSEALGTLANFQMPILTETEWDQVLTNVCLITFLQGIQVGTKLFNDYSIVTSTKNKEYVAPESLYYVNETNSDGYYHKINCSHLTDNDTDKIIGYKNSDFDRLSYEKEVVQEVKIDENGKETRTYADKKYYYYMHRELPCYYCVVNTSEESEVKWEEKANRLKAYYTALAREKMNFYKTNSYFRTGS